MITTASVMFSTPTGEIRVATVEAGTESAAIALGKIALSKWHAPESLTFLRASYHTEPASAPDMPPGC